MYKVFSRELNEIIDRALRRVRRDTLDNLRNNWQ